MLVVHDRRETDMAQKGLYTMLRQKKENLLNGKNTVTL